MRKKGFDDIKPVLVGGLSREMEKKMEQSEKVLLDCPNCGHRWEVPIKDLQSMEVVVYRSEAESEKRRVTCPNCGRGVIVNAPKALLNRED